MKDEKEQIIDDRTCPWCGEEIEFEEMESWGYCWIEADCKFCNYSFCNEPDWDCMPGGKDDY
jgi:hypothetical protein